ncbi:MAG TPA: hypothetical protein VFM18_07705 [Methanosarcina sp.]|nr:hypothetical protein [Methanosarcina sp.]
MLRDPSRNVLALAFEASREQDHETLDAVRTAMFGDFPKEFGYVNSNRLVVHIKVPSEEAQRWPEAQQ